MEIAVVGAGFSGMTAAWHLSQIKGRRVDLFDAKGIGGGASGVAAGLLHPYPGAEGRRSWQADSALAAALELIAVAERALGRPVAERSGILKIGKIAAPGCDVQLLEEGRYLITSGLTLYPALYLDGLLRATAASGARLIQAKVESLEQLSGYDFVVLAVGAGIFSFPEAARLPIGRVKGQALLATLPSGAPPLERSVVGDGYLAKGESRERFYAGSTYERDGQGEAPCFETAWAHLGPKISRYLPGFTRADVLECRAGIRVNRHGHYIPLLEKLSERCYAITAMGSRGLLYHAYFAKHLALLNNAIKA